MTQVFDLDGPRLAALAAVLNHDTVASVTAFMTAAAEVGVTISGAASARGYNFAAQVKAGLAARIREERDHDQ